jgi:hypothetical protein
MKTKKQNRKNSKHDSQQRQNATIDFGGWDVISLLEGDQHDQALAVLVDVSLAEATAFVLKHASPGLPMPYAIWPTWAYWPDIHDIDWQFTEVCKNAFSRPA